MAKIGVVMVTYNRLDMLKHALETFDMQEKIPEYVLVVNNCSTDGTYEYLEDWKNEKRNYRKEILHTKDNLGGSGGFYYGLKKAQEMEADWIWVSDDDAFPEKDTLSVMDDYIENHDTSGIAAICGKIMNHENIDKLSRRRVKQQFFRIKEYQCTDDDYEKDNFELDILTYVAAVIKKDALEIAGLPDKDYFIYYDDTEHSLMLRKVGKIICLPKAVTHHDQPIGQASLSWKRYYAVRNRLFMIKKLYPMHIFLYHLLAETVRSILHMFKKETLDRARIEFAGVKDVIRGRKGKHSVIKPGWKPKNENAR